MERAKLIKALAFAGITAAATGAFLAGGPLIAQQHLGSGVYACDGAAQAGPCQPDDDDGGDNGGSASRATGPSLNELIRRDRDNRKGWLPRYLAMAISADGKEVGSSVVYESAQGFATRKEAAEAALKDCHNDSSSPCKVIASVPNACHAATAYQGKEYIGFAPLPLPARNASGDMIATAKSNGQKAAVAAAEAECSRMTKTACRGAADIGCSKLLGAY